MISVYRKRHEDPVHFFKMERGLGACNDIDGLMQTLNINHNPLDWHLFIDSSKLSPKAVLLHNGNTLPSIPVGHSVRNKESYENMKILMEAINPLAPELFFLILAHPVYKMWIIQELNKLALWNKPHFEEKKRRV